MNRTEGQIWIDSVSPNRLKYYAGGNEYGVEVDQGYPGSPALEAGLVVKLEKDTESTSVTTKVSPAMFPDDLEKVIGLVGKSQSGTVSIVRKGTVVVPKDLFIDIDEAGSTDIIGAPVYWFIGRVKKSGDSYVYTDPSADNKGHLTLNTPSGFQVGKTSLDEEFNIGYDNLPIVGNVYSVATDTSNAIISITVDVNFSGFDRNISWSWPYIGNRQKAPTDKKVELDIRHGLFTNTSLVKPRCFCDVKVLNTGDDTENGACCIIDNYYGVTETEPASDDRRTHIEAHTPDTYRYMIHGTVVYKFCKQTT